MTEDEARMEMVAQLDEALHGESTAQDRTPQEVWQMLLFEIENLAAIHLERFR